MVGYSHWNMAVHSLVALIIKSCCIVAETMQKSLRMPGAQSPWSHSWIFHQLQNLLLEFNVCVCVCVKQPLYEEV